MNWEDPDKLLRFKFGREEYCQRMLTSLILAAPYPKWNSRIVPSDRGQAFLRQLYESAYDDELRGSFEFIDEINLPAPCLNHLICMLRPRNPVYQGHQKVVVY